MDFGDSGEFIPVIISIVVVLLIQFFMRRRRSPDADNISMVQAILSEARLNMRLTEIFSYSKAGRKFMTTSWKLYGNKLSFLGSQLETTISDAFMQAEDCNQQITSAKKYKSTSYLSSIDIGRMKDTFTDAVEGLEEWLSTQSESETRKAASGTPGMFDDFTGRR